MVLVLWHSRYMCDVIYGAIHQQKPFTSGHRKSTTAWTLWLLLSPPLPLFAVWPVTFAQVSRWEKAKSHSDCCG